MKSISQINQEKTTNSLISSFTKLIGLADLSSKTGRNVLNDGRINWQKLLCLAAAKLINALRPAIDKRRRFALIVDDTLILRTYSKKTEFVT